MSRRPSPAKRGPSPAKKSTSETFKSEAFKSETTEPRQKRRSKRSRGPSEFSILSGERAATLAKPRSRKAPMSPSAPLHSPSVISAGALHHIARLAPRVLRRLKQIDLRAPSAVFITAMATAMRITFDCLHRSSVLLLAGARRVARINPRVAVAFASFAAFGMLMTHISPESQDVRMPKAAIAPVAVTHANIPSPRAEPPKRAVTAARMIGGPSLVGGACEKQAWPYVAASCLTMAKDQTPPRNVAPEPAPVVEQKVQVVPAATSNAQAMMSPSDAVTSDDRPSRADRSTHRRRHEGWRHARTARKRTTARTVRVSQTEGFVPLASSNTPW